MVNPPSATVRIARVHYPLTALGPGRRIGIWLQGCSRACPGCLAKDTWDPQGGRELAVAELVQLCRGWESGGIDGITISGGEPFEQPDGLMVLLTALRAWTDQLEHEVDYLCYSGNPLEELQRYYPNILALFDILIPEPFHIELPVTALTGSENQPVVPLTSLGKVRYRQHLEAEHTDRAKKLQLVMEQDGSVSFLGIPERGDLTLLGKMCRARGVFLKDLSWD